VNFLLKSETDSSVTKFLTESNKQKTPEVNTHRVAFASRVPGGGKSWENMFGSVSNNFDCLSKIDVNSWDFDIKGLFDKAPQNDNNDNNNISTDPVPSYC